MSFPLYLDENVDPDLASGLRRFEKDVLTTRDAGRDHQGLSDESQLIFATSLNRALLTYDRDFEQVARNWAVEGRHHSGIIVVVGTRSLGVQLESILHLLEAYPDGIQDYSLRA